MDYRDSLKQIMQELAANGHRCFLLKENDRGFVYGYIITPADNVLYIQRDYFHWRGWSMSLQYVPDRRTGSGCECLDEPVITVNAEVVAAAEREGLAFAHRLKAKHYKSSDEWLSKYWNRNELESITA